MAEHAKPPIFQLTVESGPDVGLTYASRGTLVTIGRHGTFALTDKSVSRKHCTVEAGERYVTISDLDSANQTHLDGVSIREAYVRQGSIIEIGQTKIRVDLGIEDVAPQGIATDQHWPTLDGTRSWRSQRDGWVRYGERKYVEAALIAASRNVAQAARLAGVNRASFYRMMWRVGLR